MANTNATTSWQAKWFQANLQETLKNALVCEKICTVDRSGSFYVWNPYGSAATITTQDITGGSQGTYSVSTYTSTVDTLTVTDEFIFAEQVYDFEIAMQHGDIKSSRQDEIVKKMAIAIDKFVLNSLTEAGTEWTTDAGGFTTAANVLGILAKIVSNGAGYADSLGGNYVVVENTDLTGILLAGAGAGFTVADSWLNNGLLGSLLDVDIYVVRSGTFVSATLGSTTVTNSGHRVGGVKGISTYAEPQGIKYEEKSVSGKTGVEIMAVAYCGFKAWYQKSALTLDIILG